MRIKLPNELLIIAFLVLLLVIIITVIPSAILQLILGVPFVLFLPGYVLLAAILPQKSALEYLERLLLSFALSILIITIIGTILNYTPAGLRLYPVLISILVFIVATTAIAWYRRRRLPPVERSSYVITLTLPSWRGQSPAVRVLYVILTAVILVTIGTLSYVIVKPQAAESFTEFYAVGPGNTAAGYPGELRVGEKASVNLVIINHEHRDASYRIETTVAGHNQGSLGPAILKDGEKVELTASFTPDKPGSNQQVGFLLYKDNGTEPYLTLHIWINVKV